MPDFSFEDACEGIVCGIDEVGRGPLAGPVVAAAVVLRRASLPSDVLEQIDDSKKLLAKRREYLFHKIHEHADVSIAQSDVSEIDTINILQAALLAMRRAADGLVNISVALIDGIHAPKIGIPVKTIVKGDSRSYSIAAASIVAKHYRDQLMQGYAEQFPHYGWETNAGYGTAKHLEAIRIHGLTPLHRRSFAPVRAQIERLKA